MRKIATQENYKGWRIEMTHTCIDGQTRDGNRTDCPVCSKIVTVERDGKTFRMNVTKFDNNPKHDIGVLIPDRRSKERGK